MWIQSANSECEFEVQILKMWILSMQLYAAGLIRDQQSF